MERRSRNSTIPRYLGIDYGTKRIGLAVGDSERGIASPVGMIEHRGDLAEHVAETIAAGEEYEIDAYVLGMPFNMDGSEGAQVKITRSFGKRLAERSGKTIHEWDERLSSKAADIYLAEAGLTLKKRKARRDALAAQIILQTFLDAKRSEGGRANDE